MTIDKHNVLLLHVHAPHSTMTHHYILILMMQYTYLLDYQIY